MGHLNLFSEEFIEYINEYVDADKDKPVEERDLRAFKYEYSLPLKMLTKQNNKVSLISNDTSASVLGNSSAVLYEIIDEKDWILESYDIVAGDYASNADEIMLVVDKDNKLDINVIKNLGLPYSVDSQTGNYNSIKYTDIVDNTEYVLVMNNAYYDSADNFKEKDLKDTNVLNDLYTGAKELTSFNATTDAKLKVKISGVLKVKDNVETEILSSGLVYTPALRELYNTNSLNSDIVKYAENIISENIAGGTTGDNAYNIEFPWVYSVDVSEMSMMGGGSYVFKSTGEYTGSESGIFPQGFVAYTNGALNMNITYQQAYNMALQAVGVTKVPTAINFYPTSFDAKQNILNVIADWNITDTGKTQKILYTDLTEMLTNTMGQMIDIISYVLIAFAGISLVVSSIMIGIITYSSVIERTKEIGVLRSIGARKKDISRIFNSETILVGFFAGLLGVFISWTLTFPISAIIRSVAGGAVTTNLAILEFTDAAWLVVISTLLTTITGTVPARIASQKDPVKCLRSE